MRSDSQPNSGHVTSITQPDATPTNIDSFIGSPSVWIA